MNYHFFMRTILYPLAVFLSIFVCFPTSFSSAENPREIEYDEHGDVKNLTYHLKIINDNGVVELLE